MPDRTIIPSKGSELRIAIREDVSITHIAARKGIRTHSQLGERAEAAWGAALPRTPTVADIAGRRIVWAGPDQWLAIEPQSPGADRSAELAKLFNGLASIVDVSDSRVLFRVSARKPPDALIRSMPIDFDDRVFKAGNVAITHAAHLGFIVWRLPNGEGYEFACGRTYAKDFGDWLARTCNS